MTGRMYAVLALLAALPLLAGARLAWIQIGDDGEALRVRAEEQRKARHDVPALRGRILDRQGRALAVNTARYDLAVDPTVDGFGARDEALYTKLSDLTVRSAAHYRRAVAERSSPQYVRLARGLPPAQKEQVAALDVPGLILTPRYGRRYTYGRAAAHLLGYTGADGQGLAGLELRYDEYLHGENGYRVKRRDRTGNTRALVGAPSEQPEHGQSLQLTIDLTQQTILEDELRRGLRETGSQWGAAVALDPETGAVRAMASVPTYDPNRPGASPQAARRNRAITDQVEPGSTFKLLTAIAALEEGITGLNDSVATGEGYARIAGAPLHDTHAHGTIPFNEVIVKSSNIGAAKTAAKLKEETFYRYARDLGFGQPTWIDLPGEVEGRLRKPGRWSRTSQTRMAIGYEVAATPLQLAVAYAALANGGRVVQPHVVKRRLSWSGHTRWSTAQDSLRRDSLRRVFSEETARTLRPVFERVASEEGTAERAAVSGLQVAGKTGTARKVVGGRYRAGKYRALFAGFFPADDPEVALAVIYDEPETSIYGGVVVAPVFRRIARRWATTVPELAARLQRDDGANDDAQTEDEKAQPLPAAPAPQDALPAETRRLPDLTGRSTRRARHWLAARGVDVRLNGDGAVVRSQRPTAGTPLPEHATLTAR
ncbi:MAG: penicillin-binding protein [Bacteroidetes bacterium QS_8_68_15]|nr:MAG: penicillin-binding protein [Bacteroidetes bacterium QS_8_68_15]